MDNKDEWINWIIGWRKEMPIQEWPHLKPPIGFGNMQENIDAFDGLEKECRKCGKKLAGEEKAEKCSECLA